jgi:hypothetical protein
MPGYTAPTYSAFGRNEYLRSTVGNRFESYTVGRTLVAADADGNRVLQSGTVMAKATSGPDSGKIGPYKLDATDGRQTAANIVGVCDTFLPYQLNDFDREVSVLKSGRVVAAACYFYTSTEATPGTRGLTAPVKTSLTTRGEDLDITAL